MTTIMVSPMARLTASKQAATIPGNAAGKITLTTVSDLVAPMASEPSRNELGTATIASSLSDEMKGMIMMPMTTPAASALSDATSRPMDSPIPLTAGATTSAAKKP